MRDPRRGPEPAHVAMAALVGVPFAVYAIVLHLVAPPTASEWAAADPILVLAPHALSMYAFPIAGLVAAAVWWRIARPARDVVRESLRDALIGAGVAIVGALALRLAVGSVLPSWIPPEESAAPGLGLGMTAGYGEEVVCRLIVMPAIYFALRSRTRAAGPIAIVVTALFFAVWHLPGEPAFSARFFLTRFAMPGCFMSVVWLASPSAIVAGHSAAHLVIPQLFVGG